MANTYLYRTQVAGTSTQKMTFSAWVKRSELGSYTGLLNCYQSDASRNAIYFQPADTLAVYFKTSGSTHIYYETNRKFRDINAWYHIVVRIDTTQANATHRCRIYINGEEETSFSSSSGGSQNASFSCINQNNLDLEVGRMQYGSTVTAYYTGSMSHVHFLDGEDRTPDYFGSTDSTTGEWKIITAPTGINYGNNGFFILKDDNSNLDRSGEGHNQTIGGTLTKTEDNPSNVFCTNNALWKQESTRYLTHTRGNTMMSGGASATWYQTPGTLAFNSGKFYWECKWNAGTNLTQNHSGVIDYDKTMETGLFRAKTGSVFFTNEDGGEVHIDGPATSADYGTLAQNDILGVAVDMDAATPTVKFYKNGSLHVSVNASSLAGKFVTPAHMIYQSGEFQVNYGNGYFAETAVSSAGTNASGNGIFEYDVPTGYTALSTKGLNL